MKRAREKDAENGTMIDDEIRWWWITNEHTKKMKSSSLFVCIHAAITHTIKAKQSKWIHNKNQRDTVMAIIRWLSMSWNSRNWLIQREHVHAMWVSECVSGSFVYRMIENCGNTIQHSNSTNDSFSLRFDLLANSCWAKMFLQRCYYVVFQRLVGFNVQIK